MRWLPALATAAALLAGGSAQAQDLVPVPPLSGRVIDQTSTLTPQQTQALSDKLAAIEQKQGAQVVVLIVPTTAPEDIAAFTQRVGTSELEGIVKDLSMPVDFGLESMNTFIDWNRDVPFEVVRGEGECAV